MKRTACLLCCLAMLLWVLPAAQAAPHGLEEEIISAVELGEPLDVSSYGLNRLELTDVYESLFHRGLLPWFADSRFEWTADPEGIISTLTPRDLRERSYDEFLYEQTMAELIAATCHEGMTDEQMVLSVHDYIVARSSYSYMDTTNNGYHAAVGGTTACYGYAQLFLRVMQRLGIPCHIIVADNAVNGLGHAWNAVQVGGSWYHVDLTWDDPLTDVHGRAMHKHFLKTDEEFRSLENGHCFDWEADVRCVSKTYAADTLWGETDSPVLFPNGETMVLRLSDGVYAQDLSDGTRTLLYGPLDTPVRMGDAYYRCVTRGLSWHNGRVWFNTADTIYSMGLDGSSLTAEYQCDTTAEGRFIHSMWAENNTLYLTYMALDGTVSHEEVALSKELHAHTYETAATDATCTAFGFTTYTCACGLSFEADRVSPLGHDMHTEELTDALRHSCSACGLSYLEPVATEPPTEAPTEPAAPKWELKPINPLHAAIVVVAALLVLMIVLLRRLDRAAAAAGDETAEETAEDEAAEETAGDQAVEETAGDQAVEETADETAGVP